jgi:Cu(I)/Ag(I) efflux system membrane protein CusA/SilA
MIDKLIEFCARNRAITFIFTTILVIWGIWSIKNIPLDAIPDLSDTQVIVYSRWDRSPDIIEDQVTYPIVTALLGAPKVKTIRGFSDFGFSYVYIIFEDGVDIYWARSRTIEYLSKILSKLPEGVQTELGPDATGVGWVFQYALYDESGKHSLEELRSFQDWHLRYALQSIKGVSEVASIGGFSKQYQVNVNPNALLSYNIPLHMVISAIKESNNDVGGRLLEISGREFMVRGKGYIKSLSDIENIAVKVDEKSGVPVLIKNIANVSFGPDIRRGISDLDGLGDVVGGIVVMRHEENALKVIKRVKNKLKEIEGSLPQGVKVVTTYDRSDLITRAIDTLKDELIMEMIIVSLVILIFLLHIPSAMIPIFTLPIAVIISFIPIYFFRLSVNIMSLGGIAIAIGAMIDASIVVVENAHKKLEYWNTEGRVGNFREVLIRAIQEVARPSFFSLLVIAVSFIPIFTLEAYEGRLFKPLAFTKNFSMIIAAVLAITLDPAMRLLFTYLEPFSFKPKFLCKLTNHIVVGKMYTEEEHPISKRLFKIYTPIINYVLARPKKIIIAAIFVVLISLPLYFKLGSEFMPPLNEGTILYMPTTLPGISVTEATNLLQIQDKILKSFPEVERVFGKAGRAETSTDPAPFSMMETTVVLKPESEWRKKDSKSIFNRIWPERISYEELISEMDSKMRLPGVTNAWTMPIKGRIDMLTTGVRTPIGIKIFGDDLNKIENIGEHLEMILKELPGTRSIYAERVSGGYFVDFEINRNEIARYGLTISQVEMVIMSAIGGENITTTIENRERYGVNLRYSRDYRDDIEKLKRVLIPTMSGAQIPLSSLASIKLNTGPSMIRDENGALAGYVYVDIANIDVGTYVERAKKIVREKLKLPTGYSLIWTGQYEHMERVRERLKLVVPITLFIIFVLLFLNTKSFIKTGIIFLAVPFSLVGAILILYILNYNISIGVWVGIIALLGVDAETGVFMLLYLDLAYDEMKKANKMNTVANLKEAIMHGAVKRVRPKIMTVGALFCGLLPIMWSMGTGADVMKRIAAPMIGGIFTSFIMELIVYPAIYLIWKKRELNS